MENNQSTSATEQRFNRLRTRIRLTVIGFFVTAYVVVNLWPSIFPNTADLNIILISVIFYSIVYSFLMARFLNSKPAIFFGAISLAGSLSFILYFTGGNESIFLGFLCFFIVLIGLTLGLFPLIIMSIFVEAMVVAFYLFPLHPSIPQQALSFFLRNTVLVFATFGGGYWVVREYTSQRKQVSEMEFLNKQQELLNKEKDEVIAVVSHEFRTPLAAIKGYLDLIRTQTEKSLNQEQQGFIKKIMINVGRLQAIMENTLNVSVLESGALTLFLQPVDFEKLVTDVIENSLKFNAEDKKLILNFNLPSTRLPLISGDPPRLKQIVTNLVDNSIKYTDKGSITIDLSREREWVVMKVTDTGKGIESKDMSSLFQKFFRGGDYRNRTIQGTGLGLYITKELVDKHRGTIDIQSKLDEGTTVTVKLPIPKEDETWA